MVGHLEPGTQEHVQTAFGYFQGGRLHNLPGQPVSVLSHPHGKKVFPDVQMEPPVFVPVASGPDTTKEHGSVFFALFPQAFIYIDKNPPEPSLLQAEESQLSQPFLL